jgi:hypothetical protein
MSSFSDFKIGKVYTFDTYAPTLLGTQLKNARLTSIIDFDTANSYENILLKYRQIYPLLPVGTPDNGRLCTYYVFETESKEKVVYADQWINEDTIVVIEHININIYITDIALNDISNIRDILRAAGYFDFRITQV